MSVLFVRHAPTAYSSDNKLKESRIGGWKNLPLTPEGKLVALAAAQKYKRFPIGQVFTSPLDQAQSTARLLARAANVPLSIRDELRSWNTGKLTGQSREVAKATIEHLIASPNTPAPSGESFSAFLDRFIPFIMTLVQDPHMHGVVSHSRNAKALVAHLADPSEYGQIQRLLNVHLWNATSSIMPGEAMVVGTDGSIRKADQVVQSGSVAQPGQLAQADPRAGYLDSRYGPFYCGRCEYFKAPNACRKVAGVIEVNACCNLFSPDKGPTG